MRRPLKFALALFVAAFLLNFLWESLHGAFLYAGIGAMPALEYVPLILYASFVDAVLVVVMWGATALFFRNAKWDVQKKIASWVLLTVLGFAFALFIEIRAVVFQHRWAYSELMPLVFGIGLSPLIQLVITGMLAIVIARKISWR